MGGEPQSLDPPAGDAETRRRIDQLYREQAPRLVRRLGARLKSSDEAREVLHDGFARLLGSSSLSVLRQPEAFLNRILRNLVIDRGRRSRARPHHKPIDSESEPTIQPDQGQELELEQLRARYQRLLAARPPRTREVFLLHRAEELSYKAISARLGISPRTVEWHVAEAISRLAEGLEEK